MSEKKFVKADSELLSKAVSNSLSGGAQLLVGQWQLALWISAFVAGNGGKLSRDLISAAADTILTAYGSAADSYGTADPAHVDQMPTDGLVRNLWHVGTALAPYAFTDDSHEVLLRGLQMPGTVWQNARTVKAHKWKKPSKASGEPQSKDAYLLSLFADPAEARGFLEDYADQRERALEIRRQEAAERKAEREKEAAEREKEASANTDSADVPGDKHDPANVLTAAINAAIEKHGLEKVSAAITKALTALDKPAPRKRTAARGKGKAAQA